MSYILGYHCDGTRALPTVGERQITPRHNILWWKQIVTGTVIDDWFHAELVKNVKLANQLNVNMWLSFDKCSWHIPSVAMYVCKCCVQYTTCNNNYVNFDSYIYAWVCAHMYAWTHTHTHAHTRWANCYMLKKRNGTSKGLLGEYWNCVICSSKLAPQPR